eukprot:1445957-Rhodomonas_salina.1
MGGLFDPKKALLQSRRCRNRFFSGLTTPAAECGCLHNLDILFGGSSSWPLLLLVLGSQDLKHALLGPFADSQLRSRWRTTQFYT